MEPVGENFQEEIILTEIAVEILDIENDDAGSPASVRVTRRRFPPVFDLTVDNNRPNNAQVRIPDPVPGSAQDWSNGSPQECFQLKISHVRDSVKSLGVSTSHSV